MWLDNIRELKKRANKSSKQIAEGTFMPERTVVRIFNGETANPSITTLIPIINFLGGSFDEIFADTKAIVGDQNLVDLKESVDAVTAEKETVMAEKDLILAENISIKAENANLKDQIKTLNGQIELLEMKLAHKDELLALHNLINSIIKNR